MFNTAFLSVLKKRFILSLAVLYLMVPLQRSLSEGFHRLSHALTNTSADHHHDLDHQLGRDHTHEHKLISFFSELFSTKDSPTEQDVLFQEIKYDKHLTQEYLTLKPEIPTSINHIFMYRYGTYSTPLSVQTPPPKTPVS
ncbi:hypothetical protein [Marixanthomonas spongiae]|uniref:Uncharacterized protein n=1 Tax=Marixanthomonas spongiae TaxID=2174845 RepID=A0A2U0HYZ7_9FLAO|nr:hypothetical protein [Marixanthomonas spongiae]PVW14101.1 hypothetical protein DDV96_09800 [Marixanthomonas spongiae]